MAPLAAQAELVEMNNAELATVQGQAFTIPLPGTFVTRTLEVGVDTEFTPPTYEHDYVDVAGGVQRDSSFKTKYTVSPYFNYTSTGNITGNDYRTVESGTDIDVVDVNYSRTRTFLWFNPHR
ncbi:MAG: hypothetical protein SVO96_01490 [Pseudomonadota bacterium]|nr:hypothetical protein [Pseudomonadota bacterium]